MSKVARIFLAVYDPANPSSSGDYWAWRHPDLPKGMLDGFYYEILARDLPSDPAKVRIEDCVGGYAQLQGEWGCWYRIFNGGRDQFHRLGRFVIGCAFVRLRGNPKGNFSQILQSAQFKEISRIASKGAPLPAPVDLEFEFDPIPVAISPPALSAFLGGETVQFNGDEAIHLAGDLIASFPNDLACQCKIVGMNGSNSVSCSEIASSPPSPQPATPPLRGSLPARPATISTASKNEWFRGIFSRRVSIPIWLLILLSLVLLLLTWQYFQRRSSPIPEPFSQLLRRVLEPPKDKEEPGK